MWFDSDPGPYRDIGSDEPADCRDRGATLLADLTLGLFIAYLIGALVIIDWLCAP